MSIFTWHFDPILLIIITNLYLSFILISASNLKNHWFWAFTLSTVASSEGHLPQTWMSDGVLELVCVFYVCVIHMDWHLSPYCWQPFSMLGEWTGVPLENDKVVARQVSTFINTIAIFVNKYCWIWQGLGKVESHVRLHRCCSEAIFLKYMLEVCVLPYFGRRKCVLFRHVQNNFKITTALSHLIEICMCISVDWHWGLWFVKGELGRRYSLWDF